MLLKFNNIFVDRGSDYISAHCLFDSVEVCLTKRMVAPGHVATGRDVRCLVRIIIIGKPIEALATNWKRTLKTIETNCFKHIRYDYEIVVIASLLVNVERILTDLLTARSATIDCLQTSYKTTRTSTSAALGGAKLFKPGVMDSKNK